MIDFLLIAIVALIVIVVAYFLIDRLFPTFGTVFVNLMVAMPTIAASLLDGVTLLPWSQILTPAHVGAVMFALAVANMLMRMRGAKKAVGSA